VNQERSVTRANHSSDKKEGIKRRFPDVTNYMNFLPDENINKRRRRYEKEVQPFRKERHEN